MNESAKENSTESDLSVKEIAEQAANKETDEIKREILRKGETGAKADEMDVVGSPDRKDTMQGREEIKHRVTKS